MSHLGRLSRLHSLRRGHLLRFADGIVHSVRCWRLLPRRRQSAHTLPPWDALPGGCERAYPVQGLQGGLLPGQVPYVEAVSERAVLEVLAVRQRIRADRVQGDFTRDMRASGEKVRRRGPRRG